MVHLEGNEQENRDTYTIGYNTHDTFFRFLLEKRIINEGHNPENLRLGRDEKEPTDTQVLPPLPDLLIQDIDLSAERPWIEQINAQLVITADLAHHGAIIDDGSLSPKYDQLLQQAIRQSGTVAIPRPNSSKEFDRAYASLLDLIEDRIVTESDIFGVCIFDPSDSITADLEVLLKDLSAGLSRDSEPGTRVREHITSTPKTIEDLKLEMEKGYDLIILDGTPKRESIIPLLFSKQTEPEGVKMLRKTPPKGLSRQKIIAIGDRNYGIPNLVSIDPCRNGGLKDNGVLKLILQGLLVHKVEYNETETAILISQDLTESSVRRLKQEMKRDIRIVESVDECMKAISDTNAPISNYHIYVDLDKLHGAEIDRLTEMLAGMNAQRRQQILAYSLPILPVGFSVLSDYGKSNESKCQGRDLQSQRKVIYSALLGARDLQIYSDDFDGSQKIDALRALLRDCKEDYEDIPTIERSGRKLTEIVEEIHQGIQGPNQRDYVEALLRLARDEFEGRSPDSQEKNNLLHNLREMLTFPNLDPEDALAEYRRRVKNPNTCNTRVPIYALRSQVQMFDHHDEVIFVKTVKDEQEAGSTSRIVEFFHRVEYFLSESSGKPIISLVSEQYETPSKGTEHILLDRGDPTSRHMMEVVRKLETEKPEGYLEAIKQAYKSAIIVASRLAAFGPINLIPESNHLNETEAREFWNNRVISTVDSIDEFFTFFREEEEVKEDLATIKEISMLLNDAYDRDNGDLTHRKTLGGNTFYSDSWIGNLVQERIGSKRVYKVDWGSVRRGVPFCTEAVSSLTYGSELQNFPKKWKDELFDLAIDAYNAAVDRFNSLTETIRNDPCNHVRKIVEADRIAAATQLEDISDDTSQELFMRGDPRFRYSTATLPSPEALEKIHKYLGCRINSGYETLKSTLHKFISHPGKITGRGSEDKQKVSNYIQGLYNFLEGMAEKETVLGYNTPEYEENKKNWRHNFHNLARKRALASAGVFMEYGFVRGLEKEEDMSRDRFNWLAYGVVSLIENAALETERVVTLNPDYYNLPDSGLTPDRLTSEYVPALRRVSEKLKEILQN